MHLASFHPFENGTANTFCVYNSQKQYRSFFLCFTDLSFQKYWIFCLNFDIDMFLRIFKIVFFDGLFYFKLSIST